MKTVVEEKQEYACYEDYLKNIYPISSDGINSKTDEPSKIGINMANESLNKIMEILSK